MAGAWWRPCPVQPPESPWLPRLTPEGGPFLVSKSGTLRLRPYVSATETQSGMVLLDQRTGRYWQLNATASLVLRGLLEGPTTEEAAGWLAARHPEASERSADDVASLVRSLDEARLTTGEPD
jgi:hypothetical protein